MLKPLWLNLDIIAARLRTAPRLCVASDFDGTLTEIVAHPDQAVLHARTREALERLTTLPGAELAVLSGRPLDDLKSRIPFERAFLSGVAGLETLDREGQRRTHVQPEEAIPEEVREVMRQWCARFEGAWFEEKGPAFAVHYRSVPERFQPAFCSGVRRRFAGDSPRARLLHGKKVFDVLPAIDRNKASALWDWSASGGPCTLFYFGDDANDEPVYPKVRERDGISVAVGRWSSQAEYGVAAPGHVTWFLEWLAREWVDARAGAPMLVQPERRESPAATNGDREHHEEREPHASDYTIGEGPAISPAASEITVETAAVPEPEHATSTGS